MAKQWLKTLNKTIYILTHLMLCLATATHNIKWVKITHICRMWIKTNLKQI